MKSTQECFSHQKWIVARENASLTYTAKRYKMLINFLSCARQREWVGEIKKSREDREEDVKCSCLHAAAHGVFRIGETQIILHRSLPRSFLHSSAYQSTPIDSRKHNFVWLMFHRKKTSIWCLHYSSSLSPFSPRQTRSGPVPACGR